MKPFLCEWGYDCLNTTRRAALHSRFLAPSSHPPSYFSALNGHTLIRPLLINQLWYLSWLHFLTTLFIYTIVCWWFSGLVLRPFIRAFTARSWGFLWLDRISSRCYSIMSRTTNKNVSRLILLLTSVYLLSLLRHRPIPPQQKLIIFAFSTRCLKNHTGQQ